MHALATLLVVAAFGSLNVTSADAMALKAKKLTGSFVTAYEECTAPDTTVDGTAIPACVAVPTDTGCGFGPDGGVGKFKVIAKPTGLVLKASIKGLDPACQGETLSFTLGSSRLTGPLCAGSPCTLADAPPFAVSDCVVDTKNRCKAQAYVGLLLGVGPHTGLLGELSSLNGVQVFRDGTLTFDTGVLLFVP